MLLLVPVRIGAISGVDVSLAFVTFGVALPFLALLPLTWGSRHLLLAFFSSAASLLAGLVISQSVSMRPFVSFAYFWLSFLLFPVGWWLVRSEENLAILVRRGAAISAAVGVGVTITLLVTASPVRIEGTLMGSLVGLPLYARFGVNSLATIYAIHWCLIMVDLLFGQRMSALSVLLRLLGVVCLSYLLIFSLSRGSVVGCMAFTLCAIVFLLRYRTRLALIVLVSGFAIGGYAAATYGELISSAWSFKLNPRSGGYGAVDQATSGRYSLYVAALRDLRSRPLVGSAFSGFLTHPGETRELGDEVSSSPHNEYLMVVWKMGLLAGTIYLTLLIRLVLKASSGISFSEPSVSAGMVLMLVSLMTTSFMVWDALLVPNVGGIFFFFLGGLAAVSAQRQRNLAPSC